MLRSAAFALIMVCLVACNSKGGDAAKAANALAAAFSNDSARSVARAITQEKLNRAVAAAREAAGRIPTGFNCSLFTSNGCSGTDLEGSDGTTAVTCTENASRATCEITCDGTGKTIEAQCGDEKIVMQDMKLTASMPAPTCTDDGTNLTVNFCMTFKSMTSTVTYGSLNGQALACGATDGSQKICSGMTIPKEITAETASALSSATPTSESTLACTVDGEAVEMDFTDGQCG